MPSHSQMLPISASGTASRNTEKMVGNILFVFVIREGRSGICDPHSQYPCSSGPAPMYMDAQLGALDDGNTERFFRLYEPSAMRLRMLGILALFIL